MYVCLRCLCLCVFQHVFPVFRPRNSLENITVYEKEKGKKKLDARQTWGRLLGGVQLAAVLANATEELEKMGKRHVHKVRV